MVDETAEEAVGVEQPASLAVEVVAETDRDPRPDHDPDPENRRHRRQRRRHRRRHHSRTSRTARYEKSILHFGTAHIVLGIVCVILQMVQFSNNSIFSQAQPGLWCGTFFVITGSICLGLASTKGVYSTLAMLGFCLISLFMALTLASLSWFGAEMAAICQWYWNEYCVIPEMHPQSTTAPGTMEMIETSAKEDFPKNWLEIPLSKMAAMLYSSSNETSGDSTCHYETATNTTAACCRDLTYGDCGYDIGLGRTMHSLLVLCGVAGSTTSFVLATLACSRPNRADARSRQRFSSIFAISGGDSPPSARPITPWEFPPPSKDPLPVGGEQFPEEPPPPYEYEPNCTSYL